MSDLITHRGAQVVTREALARIPAPIGTPTFKPVAHAELVDTLTDRLQARGLVINREQYAVSANLQQIFGVLNFENGINLPGLGRAMGFHAANDKTLAIQIVAGVQVFVCDNLALSGSAVVLKRKHTRALNLSSQINQGLDRFQTARDNFEASVVKLNDRVLTAEAAKVAIFDMVYTGVIGISIMDEVAQNYFKAEVRGLEDCAPRTAWGLHNAVTRALKALSPVSKYRTTMEVGKYFDLGGEVVDAEEVVEV